MAYEQNGLTQMVTGMDVCRVDGIDGREISEQRQNLEEKYNWTRIAEQTIKVYEDTLTR